MAAYKSSSETEQRSSRRKKQKSKETLPFGCSSRFAVGAVFCVIACAAVFFAVKWDKLSPKGIAEWFNFSDSKQESFVGQISGTAVSERNFHSVDRGLIYVSDTSIVRLSHDGEKAYSFQHNFTNPMIKTSNTKSIAFNEGGSSFRILSAQGEVHRGVQGTAITDCDVNDSGFYCIISDQMGYLSKLSVYNSLNEYIYGFSFNDYYAVSVSLSEDGTMAAVGTVNTVDGQLISKIYLLSFTESEPLNIYTYKDSIVYEVKFIEEDRFVVVTDSLVSVVECGSGKELPYSYDNRVLTAYDVSFDENIVFSLSRSNDERDCMIVTLDKKGNEISSFSTDMKIFSIDVKNDKIAVLASNMLYQYNAYGDSFGSWEIGTDAKSVILPQEKTAYILGVSEIRKISLK